MSTPTCPECRVQMKPGHLLDRGHSRVSATVWVSGEPDWTGPVYWSVASKLKGHDLFRVVAYRCPECGFLRQFALTPAGRKDTR